MIFKTVVVNPDLRENGKGFLNGGIVQRLSALYYKDNLRFMSFKSVFLLHHFIENMLRRFPALLQEHQNMLSFFCQIGSFYFFCSRFIFSQFEFRKADIFQHISKICFAQDQFRLFFLSGLH